MDEQEEKLEVVLTEAADEAVSEVDHERELELRTLHFQFQIATLITSFVLLFAGLTIIYSAVAQAKHLPFESPAWFVDIVKMTVSAGLIILGVSSVSALNDFLKRRK